MSRSDRRAAAAMRGRWRESSKRPLLAQVAYWLAEQGFLDAAAAIQSENERTGVLPPLMGRPEWLERDPPWMRELRAWARREVFAAQERQAAAEVVAVLAEGRLTAALERIGAARIAKLFELAQERARELLPGATEPEIRVFAAEYLRTRVIFWCAEQSREESGA